MRRNLVLIFFALNCALIQAQVESRVLTIHISSETISPPRAQLDPTGNAQMPEGSIEVISFHAMPNKDFRCAEYIRTSIDQEGSDTKRIKPTANKTPVLADSLYNLLTDPLLQWNYITKEKGIMVADLWEYPSPQLPEHSMHEMLLKENFETKALKKIAFQDMDHKRNFDVGLLQEYATLDSFEKYIQDWPQTIPPGEAIDTERYGDEISFALTTSTDTLFVTSGRVGSYIHTWYVCDVNGNMRYPVRNHLINQYVADFLPEKFLAREHLSNAGLIKDYQHWVINKVENNQ